MSGGGKGGSTTQAQNGTTTTVVQIPAWLEDAARKNMARADALAQIGYTPYYGPDVAAFTPMQQAAMQNTGNAAAAFGLAAPVDAMAGIPQAQQFAGGVQGYSSAPMFEQSLATLQATRPGQFAALNAPFINPLTGSQPASPFGEGAGSMVDMQQFATPVVATAAPAPLPVPTGRADRDRPSTMPNPTGTLGGGGGTGSFGLPDPMSGRVASIGGSGSSGMGGGK